MSYALLTFQPAIASILHAKRYRRSPPMPGLMIRDLPSELHKLLKERAAAHRRSLSQEAIVVLEEALRDAAGPPSLEEVDRLRIHGPKPLTQRMLDEARVAGRP